MKKPSKLFGPVRAARDRHRERHRPSGFEFAIADRIAFLNADDWNHVTKAASVFLSRKYREILEQHGPNDLMHAYALVYDGQKPVAAVATMSVDVNALQVRGGESTEDLRAVDELKEKGLQRIRRRVLVCGNLLSWGDHGVALAAGVDAEAVWPGVAEALYRLRRSNRLNGQIDYVMIKDLPQHLSSTLEPLRRFSYRPLETEPDMVLQLDQDWSSFDDYLAGLTSKYRKSARKVIKGVEAAGCEVVRIQELNDERLYELYRQVEARANIRLAGLTRGYLPALADLLGSRFRCTAIKRGDEILGFVTSVQDGPQAIGYYMGVDYDANAEIPIYLRLLQITVEDAIEFGCETLSLGRTALDPKSRLGAQPVTTEVWIRHRVPIFNLAFRQLLRVISHDEPPQRNPLKE